MFLEVEEGGQDRDGESCKNLIIRFIVDLPLRLVESSQALISLASQTLYLTATLGKGLVKCMHQFRSLLQNLEERTSHV